jgi:hypothetical protein
LHPLHHLSDTIITGLILLAVLMGLTGMTEFGSQGIGNTGGVPTVGEKFGFLAIGNGDRINKKI